MTNAINNTTSDSKVFVRRDINNVTISGILAKDIKVVETNGKKIGILDLYTHRKNAKGDAHYEHFTAIASGKILENMGKCKIKKFDALTIEGHLFTSTKKLEDGSVKNYFSVQVMSFERSVMSANMTSCVLTGRLVSHKTAENAEGKKVNTIKMFDKDGKPTADIDKANTMFFTIAVDYLTRNSENIGKATQFVNCVAWGATVANLYKNVKTGYALHIVGRLNASDKRDKDGKFVARYSRIVVDRFGILARNKEENEAYKAKYKATSTPKPTSAPTPVTPPAEKISTEDVPADMPYDDSLPF